MHLIAGVDDHDDDDDEDEDEDNNDKDCSHHHILRVMAAVDAAGYLACFALCMVAPSHAHKALKSRFSLGKWWIVSSSSFNSAPYLRCKRKCS